MGHYWFWGTDPTTDPTTDSTTDPTDPTTDPTDPTTDPTDPTTDPTDRPTDPTTWLVLGLCLGWAKQYTQGQHGKQEQDSTGPGRGLLYSIITGTWLH